MKSIARRDRDQIEQFFALSGKVFGFLLKSTSVIAMIATTVTVWLKNPALAVIFFCLSVISGLVVLVLHYRRQKNAYAEHVLAISNASRFLAAHQETLEKGAESDRRRINEELLRAFRSIHDTLPRNPSRGWRVALWVPETVEKLRIVASLDISRRTEENYHMGTAEGSVNGLAWKAWQDRKNIVSNDASTDPRVDHDRHKETQSPDISTPIGSLLCHVVCLDENPVGVISIDHPEKDLFSSHEDDARVAVAGLIAISLRFHYALKASESLGGNITCTE